MRGDERSSGRDVQLCVVGAAGALGSSVARGAEGERRHAERAESRIDALTPTWTAVDCAGVHSASAAAAGVLSIRSERLLVEQIDYNLLFRWFVGLGMDDAVWNHAVFTKNRDRLLTRRWRSVLRRSEPAGEEVHVG